METKSTAPKFAFSLFVCLVALLMCAAPALAQTGTTGALTGTVTDPSGAVITGATVTATNIGTGAQRTATTGSDGAYKMSLLRPGNYRVTFTASGFKTAEIPSITISVTETALLNHSLEIGAQTQQVTVESTAVTVQTENATVGQLVPSKMVTDLPLSSRNYTQIINLSPGVVVNVASAAQLGNGTQDINVNGSGSDQNNYMMDGATITNYGSGGGAQSGNYPGIGIPNPDAIQEFKVQTSQYDAAYGQNPGASVNVVTKSGTNQFHGAAWEFNRNNFFNANDFFLKQSQAQAGFKNSPPTLKQNQFGGTLGGPIKKDKIFFFGSYQGTRQLNGVGTNGFSTGHTTVSLLPFNEPGFTGADARADHPGLTVPLNLVPGDPTNFPACDASTYRKYLGCAFSGNMDILAAVGVLNGTGVPVATDGSNINQVAINVLQATVPSGNRTPYNQGFYVPSILGDYSNGLSCLTPDMLGSYTSTCSLPTNIIDPVKADEDQFVVNTDFVLSDKHTLTEKLFYSNDPQVQSFVCLGGCYPGAPELADYKALDTQLKLTSVLTSNLVNEARISYQREVTNSHDGLTLQACDVGIIPSVNEGDPCPAATSLPNLQIIPVIATAGLPDRPDFSTTYGGWNLGGNFFAADTNYFNTYQYADNLSWNHGKHAIRTGFEAQRIQWNWTLLGPGRGELLFGNLADFLTSGSGPAGNTSIPTTPSFVGNGLLANITTRNSPTAPNLHYLRVNQFSAYAEDDIKVLPNLTVNLGIRWEFDGFPSDARGLFTNVWTSQAALYNTGSQLLNDPNGSLIGFVVGSGYDPVRNFNLTAPNGATGVYVNTNKTLMHGAPYANFAPRIGLAWRATSKFVVRAGYGIFYDRIYGNLLGNNQQGNPPYAYNVATLPCETLDNPSPTGQDTGSGPCDAGGLHWTPRFLSLPFGDPNAPQATTSILTVSGSNLGSTSDAENMGTPLIQQYNLDLQYEFAKNWVADIGYVGTHGTHLYDWARPINIAHLVAGAPNEPTDPQNAALITSSLPFNDVNNPNPITVNTVNNARGRVTYLGFTPTGFGTTSTVGDHLYNSLQLQLRHQFSHGLLFQASYTWSKLMTNINSSQGGGGISAPGNVLSGGANSNNPLDFKQQYAVAAFNRAHRLVVSYSYEFPYRHMDGLEGHILGGWSISGVTTIQNGAPFTVIDGGGGTIFGTAGAFGGSGIRAALANPANCNSSGVCSSGTPIATSGSNKSRINNWINAAAFIPLGSIPASSPYCIGGVPNPGAYGTPDPSEACGTAPRAPNTNYPGDPGDVGAPFINAGTGFGNSGIGSILGPGQHNWDMALIKNTKVTEGTSIQFRAEFFNVWNHAQFGRVQNDINAAFFGSITQTVVPPRVVQFGVKFLF
jgi:hypothetical protein